MWNLFCFHMLEEPPVLFRITYRDHRFKTFRCCGSSASLPFPLAASGSQPVISLHSLLSCSLSHCSPPSPPSCPWVRRCAKQMNVFMLAVRQWFWEVISLNTAVPLFIFVTFCSLPHLKSSSGGGCSSRSLLCGKVLENCTCTPIAFLFRPLWAHILRLEESFKYLSSFLLDDYFWNLDHICFSALIFLP